MCKKTLGVRAEILLSSYCASKVLCRALFRGCAEILVLGRNIHLWIEIDSVVDYLILVNLVLYGNGSYKMVALMLLK